MSATTHVQLKTALRVNKREGLHPDSISEFARQLEISHTSIIHVAQGAFDSEWISNAIKEVITKARNLNPDLFDAAVEAEISLSKAKSIR